MALPRILLRYIFREMRNTFLVTAVALTIVLSLGGGVLNIIKIGDITPSQFGYLIILVIPVAAALTVPIATLFSAASTYGRLASDNELVACRASGINLHVLLLPTLAMSLLSAVLTFALASYVIPSLVQNLNEFLTADVRDFVLSRLKDPRGIKLGGRYRVQADQHEIQRGEADAIVLHRAVLIESDGSEWTRVGTARDVSLALEQVDDVIRVSGSMHGLNLLDRRTNDFAEVEHQTIAQAELSLALPAQAKFLTLGELFYFHKYPERWRQVQTALQRLRQEWARKLTRDRLVADWAGAADHRIVLGEGEMTVVIRAERAARVPQEGGVELTTVKLEELRHGERRVTDLNRALLEATLPRGDAGEPPRVVIHASGAKQQRGYSTTMGPFSLPPQVTRKAYETPDGELLSAAQQEAPTDHPMLKRAADAEREWSNAARRMSATIHERFAFSVSVFVLVLLGAILGILFRGAHALVAFGISFIPLAFVVVAIVTGRQLAQNEPTHQLGLASMWGGIFLVALVDFWAMMRWVRR